MRSKICSFVGNFSVSVQQCMLHKHVGVQEKVRKIEENSLNPKPNHQSPLPKKTMRKKQKLTKQTTQGIRVGWITKKKDEKSHLIAKGVN